MVRRNASASVILLMLLGLGTGDVAAQAPESPETARAEAARLHEEGNRLFDLRRFADAVRVLRRSLELRPTPTVAFNLAQSLRSTGRLLEAIELYDGLLDDRYGRLPRRRRRGVRTQREATQEGVGAFRLRVSGAEQALVRVDGVRVGSTEAGVTLERPIDPGAHVVTVSAPSYEMAEREFTVPPGGEAELELTLELTAQAAMGRLVVVAPDEGDLLTVEGLGEARGRLESVAAPGVYEVVLDGPSGRRRMSTEVTGGETRTLLLEALADDFPLLEVLLVGALTLAAGGGVALGLALTIEVEEPVEGVEPWGVLISLGER